MGIRIHKTLGYGLTDVIANTDSWTLKDDPRFDPDGYMFNYEEDKYNVEGFKQYLIDKIGEIDDDDFDRFDLRLLLRGLEAEDGDSMKLKLHGFYDVIKYDMEFGDPTVLVTVPPSCVDEWSRYNDAIDYYDPVNLSADGGSVPSVIQINRALWPWESYIDISTNPPTRLTGETLRLFYMLRRLVEDDDFTAEPKHFECIGVKDLEEMQNNIVPVIPIELVEVLKYLKIFKDEKTIYEFRPLIYGYWG